MSRRHTCPLCLREVHHSRGFFPRFHQSCAEQAYIWSVYGYDTYAVYRKAVIILAPQCYICADAPSRDVEHVVPESLGGLTEWGNLGAACQSCNSRKGTRVDVVVGEVLERLKAQQADFKAAYERSTRNGGTDALVDVVRREIGRDDFEDGAGDLDEAIETIVEANMELEAALLDAQWNECADEDPPPRDARSNALRVSREAARVLLPDANEAEIAREVSGAIEMWFDLNDDEYMAPLHGSE